MKEFLNKRANANAVNKNGAIYLHLAVFFNRINIEKVLLNNIANTNVVDKEDETLLLVSAMYETIDIVK